MIFFATRFKNAEIKYTHLEQMLLALYRFYPAFREIAGTQPVHIHTPYPSLKEANKQTVEGAIALLSRWGKFMLIDPQVKFQVTGQALLRPKPK